MRFKNELPKKLAIAVCCHFNESRLIYLNRISDEFVELGAQVKVIIVTNTFKEDELAKIEAVLSGKGFEFEFLMPNILGHPLLLTWIHFAVFKELLSEDSWTHFVYLEDDTLITKENIKFWIEGRELLRPYQLIPSFLRGERKVNNPQWYCSDCPNPLFFYSLPRIRVDENLGFINIPGLYQGMYLMDRQLMTEFFEGPAYNPNFGIWGIQEKAAQGITFLNVPNGYSNRNLIPYKLDSHQVDERCIIHHLPNNYAQPGPGVKVVKTVPVQQLLSEWPTKAFLILKLLKTIFEPRLNAIR